MSAYLSLHWVKSITAQNGGTSGAPLKLEIHDDGRFPHEVTLFTDDPILNDRLVEAINRIARERREEKEAERAKAQDEAPTRADMYDDGEEIVF